MITRTFRITVRGVFTALTDEQKAELLANAAQHDILQSAYTPEGHLSYDIAARPAFTFRFQDSGENDEDLPQAAERAEQTAREWLDGHGYAYKNLKSHAEDLL